MRISIPWVARLLWDPVSALDLRDKTDKPDHAKIVPFLFLTFACAAHFVTPLSWWELLALGSLSFGYGAWRTFLSSRAVSGTFNQTETITRTIVEQRDAAKGIQPTP